MGSSRTLFCSRPTIGSGPVCQPDRHALIRYCLSPVAWRPCRSRVLIWPRLSPINSRFCSAPVALVRPSRRTPSRCGRARAANHISDVESRSFDWRCAHVRRLECSGDPQHDGNVQQEFAASVSGRAAPACRKRSVRQPHWLAAQAIKRWEVTFFWRQTTPPARGRQAEMYRVPGRRSRFGPPTHQCPQTR